VYGWTARLKSEPPFDAVSWSTTYSYAKDGVSSGLVTSFAPIYPRGVEARIPSSGWSGFTEISEWAYWMPESGVAVTRRVLWTGQTISTTVAPAAGESRRELVGAADEQVEVPLTLRWTGATLLTLQGLGFGDYAGWFAVGGPLPLQLTGKGPMKTSTVKVAVKPPATSPPGNHTVPVEVRLTTAGYAQPQARGFIYLTIKRVATALPQPAAGPIPEAVGYALGLTLIAAVALALRRRS